MTLIHFREPPIALTTSLYERLVTEITRKLPQKSFGYLVSDIGPRMPTDFVSFQENVRNDQPWRSRFESHGRYFVDHDDAGFVATPEESWRVQREIWARGLEEVAVFHSHQRHPANFSSIDYEMHRERFKTLWHLIVSMRNPNLPQLRAFAITAAGVRELPIRAEGSSQRSEARRSNRVQEPTQ